VFKEETMQRILIAAAALVVMGVGPAHSEITVNVARFASGVLTVQGETSRPHQRVTLDRRFRTRTDRNNRFSFRVRYRPRDCIASLRAGRDAHPAVIANCVPKPPRRGRAARNAR
jgi:hypothetical protein